MVFGPLVGGRGAGPHTAIFFRYHVLIYLAMELTFLLLSGAGEVAYWAFCT